MLQSFGALAFVLGVIPRVEGGIAQWTFQPLDSLYLPVCMFCSRASVCCMFLVGEGRGVFPISQHFTVYKVQVVGVADKPPNPKCQNRKTKKTTKTNCDLLQFKPGASRFS